MYPRRVAVVMAVAVVICGVVVMCDDEDGVRVESKWKQKSTLEDEEREEEERRETVRGARERMSWLDGKGGV